MRTIPLIPDLIREFTVSMTGADCTATAVWFQKLIEDGDLSADVRQAIDRACTHWDALTEDEQYVVGPFFGLGEPHGERWPFAQVIMKDYTTFLSFCMAVFDDEPYGG